MKDTNRVIVASNLVIKGFVLSYKRLKDSTQDEDLLRIDTSLNEYKNLFFGVLHKVLACADESYEDVKSLKRTYLTYGINANLKESLCSDDVKTSLYNSMLAIITDSKSILKEIEHDRKLFYVCCVMNFNDIVEELKKNGKV